MNFQQIGTKCTWMTFYTDQASMSNKIQSPCAKEKNPIKMFITSFECLVKAIHKFYKSMTNLK